LAATQLQDALNTCSPLIVLIETPAGELNSNRIWSNAYEHLFDKANVMYRDVQTLSRFFSAFIKDIIEASFIVCRNL
jgi:hypothetical protein